LRLLRSSAPAVLDQTFDSYLSSLRHCQDLALPLIIPVGADTARKIQLGVYETASRALEVLIVRIGREDAGEAIADGVCAVLSALHEGGNNVNDMDDVVWTEGAQMIETLLSNRESRLFVGWIFLIGQNRPQVAKAMRFVLSTSPQRRILRIPLCYHSKLQLLQHISLDAMRLGYPNLCCWTCLLLQVSSPTKCILI
jgi:hypothetical protein